MALLDVTNLCVRIPTEDGDVHAVQDVSFSVQAGELFGIVGESGSGKSVLTQAITGLLPGAEITGSALLNGEDLLTLDAGALRRKRGAQIGMVFQDPLSSLNPFYTVGAQLVEAIRAHRRIGRTRAKAMAVEMLDRVGIPDAGARFGAYPHQFSGGMRQRVMIAMALLLRPELVIADEPTTALDVTVQAQIVDLLDEMRRELGTTVIMITHDLGLISTVADDVMVMYAGNRMETGSREAIFGRPAHPYTAGLLASSPGRGAPGQPLPAIPGRPPSLLQLPSGCVFSPRCPQAMATCATPPPVRRFADGGESACWLEAPAAPAPPGTHPADGGGQLPNPDVVAPIVETMHPDEYVVEVSGVRLAYPGRGFGAGKLGPEVLRGVDLQLARGETLGLVGESGCGKSTLARVIAGLIDPTAGAVRLAGYDLRELTPKTWQVLRKEVQLVFQDPFGSLNPKRRVGAIIADPLRIHQVAAREERRARVKHLMEVVGLKPEHYNRFPSEFSGGERQRIGIARALALNPSLIICDEPVSALDVSVQAQVLNLMADLQAEFGLSYLFISHDLAVVRHVADRIAVMEAGQIVETGSAEQVYGDPVHPFTKRLLAATMHTEPPSDVTRSLVGSGTGAA